MNDFDRGEPVTITVNCDDEDGDNLDVSGFNTIIIKVIHKHLGTLLDKLTLGDGEIVISDTPTDGNVTFIVPGSVTASAALGVYKYQIRTSETDTDYNDNVRHRVFSSDAFYLKKAVT